MRKDGATYRGFGELAKELLPNSSQPEAEESSRDDLAAELRRLRVDHAEHAGLQSHHFDSSLSRAIGDRFRQLADRLYERSVVKHWKQLSHEETDRIAEGLSALNDNLAFQFEAPCLYVMELDNPGLPDLPANFAFKGGVARKTLARLLRVNVQTSTVRDIDVVFHGRQVEPAVYDRVAKSLMQEDWIMARNPNKVIAKQTSAKGYFRTHEFTINQLWIKGDHLTCTAQALCDLVGNVVRPTAHHLRVHRGGVDSIVAAKAVRFFVEGKAEGRPMRLDEFRLSAKFIRHFHLALHLARALESGDEIGHQYLLEIGRRRLSRFRYRGNLEDAIRRLAAKIDQPLSFFGR